MKLIFLILIGISYLKLIATEIQVIGDQLGTGVVVSYRGNEYLATPTHVLFSKKLPVVKIDNKTYEINEFLSSSKRDLTLLKLNEKIEFHNDIYYLIENTQSVNNSDLYFEFDITKSNLAEYANLKIKKLQGLSGKLVKFNGKIGLFQGCLVDQNQKIQKYLAIDLTNLTDEFQKVEFQEYFLKKYLQNSSK